MNEISLKSAHFWNFTSYYNDLSKKINDTNVFKGDIRGMSSGT